MSSELPFPVNMVGMKRCASRAEARVWAYAAADDFNARMAAMPGAKKT